MVVSYFVRKIAPAGDLGDFAIQPSPGGQKALALPFNAEPVFASEAAGILSG